MGLLIYLDTQITCLYDMDIPRPENFNETYLYEGTEPAYTTNSPPAYWLVAQN